MGCRTWKIKIKYCPWPFSAIALRISKVELRGATAEASRPPQNPYHQVHRETDQRTRALSHANTLLLFLVTEGLKLRLCRELILLHIYSHSWQVPVTELLGKSSPGLNPRAQRKVHRPLLNKGGVPAGPAVNNQWEACAPQLEEACAQQGRSRAAINK